MTCPGAFLTKQCHHIQSGSAGARFRAKVLLPDTLLSKYNITTPAYFCCNSQIIMSYTKIYFNDVPLLIADEDIKEDETIKTIVTTEAGEILPIIKTGGLDRLILRTTDIELSKNEIFDDFKLAKAGGGVVRNINGDILLIYRRRHWDMPKGHLEDNETLPACALREVSEETGLKHLHIIHKTAVTYHVYRENKRDILKETHWFFMDNYQREPLRPQVAEDIEKAEWVAFSDMHLYFDAMYPSIRDVLKPLAGSYLRS